MTNTVRMLLKAAAVLAITAAFGSASFAGEFTVHQGKRYRATLALNSVERLTDNALIARRFRALGFSKVRVSGAGAVRRVEGVWHRKDASATLPRQIVVVIEREGSGLLCTGTYQKGHNRSARYPHRRSQITTGTDG